MSTALIVEVVRNILKVERKRMSEALRRDMSRRCPASSGGI